MYSASTTQQQQQHYMQQHGINPAMAFQQQQNQCTSYGMQVAGGGAAEAAAASFAAMHQQQPGQGQAHPMQHHWTAADYYQHQQQQAQAYAQQQQAQQQQQQQKQQKGVKRKPATNSDRPNKMPYSHPTPQFAFSQAAPGGPLDPATMPTMSADDYHLQPMNGHLSPYRYSPGGGAASSPYWPAAGGQRPPSRSEMVRMELRNSLQAKQMAANQQRHPGASELPLPAHSSTSSSSSGSSSDSTSAAGPVGFGADSLGFDLDIVLKDSDGSLMDAELDTVFDWKLGGGCGFDMDNESTKCLVMKLLS